jgi:hypothetical protein
MDAIKNFHWRYATKFPAGLDAAPRPALVRATRLTYSEKPS